MYLRVNFVNQEIAVPTVRGTVYANCNMAGVLCAEGQCGTNHNVKQKEMASRSFRMSRALSWGDRSSHPQLAVGKVSLPSAVTAPEVTMEHSSPLSHVGDGDSLKTIALLHSPDRLWKIHPALETPLFEVGSASKVCYRLTGEMFCALGKVSRASSGGGCCAVHHGP